MFLIECNATQSDARKRHPMAKKLSPAHAPFITLGESTDTCQWNVNLCPLSLDDAESLAAKLSLVADLLVANYKAFVLLLQEEGSAEIAAGHKKVEVHNATR